ncbi:MAG TPA: Asp-tRNA(Asn)/Glu-tRNA(Gln) amidotransferase subunit GatB [Candidatus Saccharimonadales bacterium]|jgi:aspartyl-tRNA(Asn)/glutamyl-tRNA(Gln) amidotransferase subunit B
MKQELMQRYRPTIGIECHVQLATTTKLFSGADNDARDRHPNTTVSPICFGLPGVLPVLNEQAIELAIKAGLALNADVPELSRFERKHYFYPDLPKGYQITQLAEPVIVGGNVNAEMLDGATLSVRIHHAHLEEDAGKLTHPTGQARSLVDLNRAGTPLIEIVSEPDMHSPAEARAYVTELYRLMTFAGVTRGDLYHGNMRFDVNISLADHDATTLGTRAEIKNLNSFRAVERAAEYEWGRQAELLAAGKTIVQETRGWNEDAGRTFSQRSKSDAHDYRYFPDPDIPPVRISRQTIERVRQTMPHLPDEYRRLLQPLGLDRAVITTLLSDRRIADIVLAVLGASEASDAKRVALWYVGAGDEVTMPLVGDIASRLLELSHMTKAGELSSTAAKAVFAELARSDESARGIAQRLDLLQLNDEAAVIEVVEAVLNDPASAKALADITSGNDKAIGYLVGQVMKQSRGKADPAIATRLLKERI